MNKEALRKELEDAVNAGIRIKIDGYESHIVKDQLVQDYITTRLAALDDGDGKVVMAKCDECERDIYDDEVALNLAGIYCWECCKKMWGMDETKKDLVDDGQEGKGLEGTLNENKPMEEGHQTVKCYTSEELEKSFLRSACEGYQDAKFNGKKHENVYALINPIQSKEWFKWLEEKNVIK